MKQISKKLMIVYVVLVVIAMVIVVLFETETLDAGVLATEEQSKFLFTTFMELGSLAAAFFGLRLFKFNTIHNDLVTRKEPAMMKWGLIRLLILELPMVINTLLYYIYMYTTFGYLAIILFLCLPFVLPTLNRCLAETSEEA